MKALIAILLFAASAQAADFPTFMTGAWHGTFGGTVVDEQWTNANGGVMLATSRTISPKGKTTFEFLRIEQRNGTLVYLAMPQARPETPFALKSMTATRVVFENLDHDFPQRIIYWRDGAKLCGRVEGTRHGKLEGEEWCWTQAVAAVRGSAVRKGS